MGLIQEIPQDVIKEAIKIHGHLAPGIILGFKMVQRAFLEFSFGKDDVVILVSETTRCIPDGIQAISRHLLIHGGYSVYLRTYDVGKLAIQVNKNHEDLFRVTLNADYLTDHPVLYSWVYLSKSEQASLEDVRESMWCLDIRKAFKVASFRKRLKPEFKKKQILECPLCGEPTAVNSMIEYDGRLTCKTCVFFEKT